MPANRKPAHNQRQQDSTEERAAQTDRDAERYTHAVKRSIRAQPGGLKLRLTITSVHTQTLADFLRMIYLVKHYTDF